MTDLIRMTKDCDSLSVHPSTVADHERAGWTVSAEQPEPGDDGPTDDELRAAIESATGKAPHHKTGRAKLLEQYDALETGEAKD